MIASRTATATVMGRKKVDGRTMSLQCGIVGLPNVGKSTLFNALTAAKVAAENYPFCTIEPNKGVVQVPDNRLTELADICQPDRIVPTTIEFVDIAGLVMCEAAEALKNQGATGVSAYITHPVLSGPAVERIAASVMDELVVTDTIPLSEKAKQCDKIRQLSVAVLLAETMRRISDEESVSSLYVD